MGESLGEKVPGTNIFKIPENVILANNIFNRLTKPKQGGSYELQGLGVAEDVVQAVINYIVGRIGVFEYTQRVAKVSPDLLEIITDKVTKAKDDLVQII